MGFLEKTIQWIKGVFKGRDISTMLEDEKKILYPYPNIDELLNELKVREEAAIAAQSELPTSDSKNTDANEKRIELFFRNRVQKLNWEADEKLVTYNTRMQNIDIDADYQKIKNLSKNIKQKASNLNQQFKLELSEFDIKKTALKHEMDSFRQINRLHRGAEYPESKWLFYSIILVFLLAESILNGTFLAKGSELGLLGGVRDAIILAALNIFPAYIIGTYFLPLANHIKPAYKFISYVAVLVYASLLILINYFIANYREEMEIMNTVNPFQDAIQNMASLHIPNSMHAILLGILGLTFSLVVFFKGYNSDDKYPSYGKLDRKLNKATDDYNQCRYDILDELDLLKNDSLSERTELISRLTSDIDDIKLLHQLKIALVQKYSSVAQYLRDSCGVAVTMYRDTNLGIRKTPAPAYFQKRNILPNKLFRDFDIDGEGKKIASELAISNEINKISADIKNEVEEIYNDCLSFLGEIDNYFKDIGESGHGDKKESE